MSILSLFFPLLAKIYPLPEKSLERTRPLQVLALGLSRTGTESLRQALIQLGYEDCHHGFRYITSPDEILQWCRLSLAQQRGDKQFLNAKEFDKVLGDCAAVTDTPCCMFAEELIRCFADAKVVLNYREDVEAWHTSVQNTIETHNDLDLYSWILALFQPHLFWNHFITISLLWRRHFNYDFEKNGRKWYREHYRRLEEILSKEGHLKWKVEDGWEPLCRFLDKPIPDVPFPSGNTPQMYQDRMAVNYARSRKEAERNLRIAVVIVALLLSTVAYMMR